MNNSPLYQAAANLAAQTLAFTDRDLDQPWSWGPHDEGVRFAFLGSYQELRELAVSLRQARYAAGRPPTTAQHILAQHHTTYRDLQAVLLGVTDELYSQAPSPNDWPLRYVLGHVVGAERHFFTLVHYGLARHLANDGRSPRLPDGETDKVVGAYADFRAIMDGQGVTAMLAFYDVLHQRMLAEFAGMSEAALAAPSIWWEEQEFPLAHRLHRFDAHARQHIIHAEKTLDALGQPPTEVQRLLRQVYQALAEAEGQLIGAPEIGLAEQMALAEKITGRAAEVAALVQDARALLAAVKTNDLDLIHVVLQANPTLVNARDQNGLSAVMVAAYHGQREVLDVLLEKGAALSIFEGAATGREAAVRAALEEWPGWLNEYSVDGFTPLQTACFFGHEAVALLLIAQGADVNAVARHEFGIRPVHAAAANGHHAILRALLDHGADVNARQQHDFTPLHEAYRRGDEAMVQLLLAYGADPTLKDDQGRVPPAMASA